MGDLGMNMKGLSYRPKELGPYPVDNREMWRVIEQDQ